MAKLGTLQFSFLFLNIIFWCVGIALVGFIAWTLDSLPSNTEFLSGAFAFLYICLFLGLFIAATGLIGCLGGLFRALCLLKCYLGFMIAFIFIEIALVIGAYTQQEKIPSAITSTWSQFNNDTKFSIQSALECCGIHNYTEYGNELDLIPYSCFRVYDILTTHTKAWTLLFRASCLDQIQGWFSSNLPIVGAGLGMICLIQIGSMFLSASVIINIGEKFKVHPDPDYDEESQSEQGTSVTSLHSCEPSTSHQSDESPHEDDVSETSRKLSLVPEEDLGDTVAAGALLYTVAHDTDLRKPPSSTSETADQNEEIDKRNVDDSGAKDNDEREEEIGQRSAPSECADDHSESQNENEVTVETGAEVNQEREEEIGQRNAPRERVENASGEEDKEDIEEEAKRADDNNDNMKESECADDHTESQSQNEVKAETDQSETENKESWESNGIGSIATVAAISGTEHGSKTYLLENESDGIPGDNSDVFNNSDHDKPNNDNNEAEKKSHLMNNDAVNSSVLINKEVENEMNEELDKNEGIHNDISTEHDNNEQFNGENNVLTGAEETYNTSPTAEQVKEIRKEYTVTNNDVGDETDLPQGHTAQVKQMQKEYVSDNDNDF